MLKKHTRLSALLLMLPLLAALLLTMPRYARAEGHDHNSYTEIHAAQDGSVYVGESLLTSFTYDTGFSAYVLPSGHYYLSGDVTLPGSLISYSGTDVTLCLNGRVLNLNGGYYMTLGSFTLEDCCTEQLYAVSDEDADGRFENIQSSASEAFTPVQGKTYLYPTGGIITNGGGAFGGVWGGAICVISVTAEAPASYYMTGGNIIGCAVNNTAGGNVPGGGGVCCFQLATFNMSGGSICGNKASQGTVYLGGSCSGTMTGGTIAHNTTAVNGGGVTAELGASFTLNGGSITDNSSVNGGGVYISNNNSAASVGVLNVAAGTISGNSATNGGGIHAEAGTQVNISGGSVSGNSAVSYGGGVYGQFNSGVAPAADINVTGGTFTENSAGGGGGAFLMQANSSLEITNASISENSTSVYGGAIFNLGSTSIGTCTITGNTAGNDGGAICSTGSLILVGEASLTGNRTDARGGGVSNYGALTLGGSTVMRDNTGSEGDDNLCLRSDSTMNFFTDDTYKPREGMRIGVSVLDAANTSRTVGAISTGGAGLAKYFFGDREYDTVISSAGGLSLARCARLNLRNGETVDLNPETFTTPTWKDYTFSGISASYDGTPVEYGDTLELTDFTAGTTYYALWANTSGHKVITLTLNISDIAANTAGYSALLTNTGISYANGRLTLDNATIDCSGMNFTNDATFGLVQTTGEMYLELAEGSSNTVLAANGGNGSYGIFGGGNVTLMGKGALTVKSGTGATVTAGIAAFGTITVQSEGALLAVGQSTEAVTTNAYGLYGCGTYSALRLVGKNITAEAEAAPVSVGIFAAALQTNGAEAVAFGCTAALSADSVTVKGNHIYMYTDTAGTQNETEGIPDASTSVVNVPPTALYCRFFPVSCFDDCMGKSQCARTDYTEGQTYFTEAGKSYKFLGWYTDPCGLGDKLTGEAEIRIYYAAWQNGSGNTVITDTLYFNDFCADPDLYNETYCNCGISLQDGILTLNNATIDCSGSTYAADFGMACVLYATGDRDLNLLLVGNSCIIGAQGAAKNYGICAEGNVTVSGSGDLLLRSGSGYESTFGMLANGNISFTATGTVTVTAQTVHTDTCTHTVGVSSAARVITVENGTILATAGEATLVSMAIDTWAQDCGTLHIGKGACVTAIGGKATGETGASYGINSPIIYIDTDASVIARSGEAFSSPGIDCYTLTVTDCTLTLSGYTKLLPTASFSGGGGTLTSYTDTEGTLNETAVIADEQTGLYPIADTVRCLRLTYAHCFDNCLGRTDCTADTYTVGQTYFTDSKNYTFLGWFTLPDGRGEKLTETPKADTYYAAWQNGSGHTVRTTPLDLSVPMQELSDFGMIWSANTLTMNGVTVDCSGVTRTVVPGSTVLAQNGQLTYCLSLPENAAVVLAEGTENTVISCSGSGKNTMLLSPGGLTLSGGGDLTLYTDADCSESWGIFVYGALTLNTTGKLNCTIDGPDTNKWKIGMFVYNNSFLITSGDISVNTGSADLASIAMGSWGDDTHSDGTLLIKGNAHVTAVSGAVSGTDPEHTESEAICADSLGFDETCVVSLTGGSGVNGRAVDSGGITVLGGDITMASPAPVLSARTGLLARDGNLTAKANKDSAAVLPVYLNEDGLLVGDKSAVGWLHITFGAVKPYQYTHYMAGEREYLLLSGSTQLRSRSDNAYCTADYYYSDGYFDADPTEYNEHLASVSAALAAAADSKNSIWTEKMLTTLGFTQITVNEAFRNGTSAAGTCGYAVASKALTTADGAATGKTLIALTLRSGDGMAELATLLNMGASGDHAGVSAAASAVVSAVGQYITDQGLTESDLLFWVTGQSYGGTVADLAAKSLTDAHPGKVFACTVGACAAGTDKSKSYDNIFNLVSGSDWYTVLCPADYGFFRYGVDKPLTVTAESAAALDPSGSYCDSFHIAYLSDSLWDLLGGVNTAVKTFSTQLTMDEYLSDLSGAVTKWSGHAASRSGYTTRTFPIEGYNNTDVTLQSAMTRFFSLSCSLNNATRAMFEAWFEEYLNGILSQYGTGLLGTLTGWTDMSAGDKTTFINGIYGLLENNAYGGFKMNDFVAVVMPSYSNQLKADFPVLADCLIEFICRDYNKNYTAQNRPASEKMYLNATLFYNMKNDSESLLWQNGAAAYLSAVQSMDSFYTDYVGMKKSVESIAITAPAAMQDYRTGENFDPAGLELTVTYSDGTAKIINDYILTVDAPEVEGEVTVTLTYCGLKQQFTVYKSRGAVTADQTGKSVSYTVDGELVTGEKLLAVRFVDGQLLDYKLVEVTEATRTGTVAFDDENENAQYILFLIDGDGVAMGKQFIIA